MKGSQSAASAAQAPSGSTSSTSASPSSTSTSSMIATTNIHNNTRSMDMHMDMPGLEEGDGGTVISEITQLTHDQTATSTSAALGGEDSHSLLNILAAKTTAATSASKAPEAPVPAATLAKEVAAKAKAKKSATSTTCSKAKPKSSSTQKSTVKSPAPSTSTATPGSSTSTRETAPATNLKKAAPSSSKPTSPKSVANLSATGTTSTTPNTTSTPNAGAGLSELSKQLRVQRAKNEWQHNEIARLERQLRILSDLKGISVADLRYSLESACEQEAHGELRNQVMSLQAQLEALQMQRSNNIRRASTANTEATQAKIATLQLRIGELEEVDQVKQNELKHLYQQLQQQTARATTLEATNQQQQTQLKKFEQVAQIYVQDVEGVKTERDALKQRVEQLMQQLADQDSQRKCDQAMREIEAQIELEQQKKQAYIHNARQQQQQQSAAAATIAMDPFDNDDVSHLGDEDHMSMSVCTMDALMMQGLTEEQAKEALAKDTKIASLYDDLKGLSSKASQLQTLCANQKAQIDRFAEQLNEKESALRSTQSNCNFAKEEHDKLYKRFCDIELHLHLEQERVEGLERQLEARIQESDLRNDQFKCRFQVQSERIMDLEQQQQSLYTAFELLQQEVRAQDSEHHKLKSSLDEADSEVARQLREAEKKHRSSRRRYSSSSSGVVVEETPASATSLSATQTNHFEASASGGRRRYSSSSGTPPSASLSASQSNLFRSPVATATPVASQAQAFASFHNNTNNEATTSSRSLYHDPSQLTPQQQGIDHPMQTYGYLYKLDKLKGWKKRFFVLYGEGGVYEMTYSDSPKERVKGRIRNITMGVSTVSETNKSIKRPFSFVLHVDPLQHNGQVLYAAASTADDFKKWMRALKAAVIRPEDSLYMSQPDVLSAEAQMEADLEIARRLQSGSSSRNDLDHPNTSGHHPPEDRDSQMEADHLMAMRLQIQNQSNQAFA